MVYAIVIACLVCRDVQQYPHGQQMKGVLILRVQGPLCFANVEHIKDTIAEHEVSICSNGAPVTEDLAVVPNDFHATIKWVTAGTALAALCSTEGCSCAVGCTTNM